MPGAEGGRLPLDIRRARAGEEEAVLIPCTRPSPVPPGGRADLVDEAARARAAWLREGISAGVLRVMVAWVPAPTDACIDYPGYGPVPTEALSHGGNVPAGLVEYAPASHAAAPVKGEDVWVIHCVWVIPDAGRAPDAGPAKRSVKLVFHSRCPAATLVRDSLAAHFARRGDVEFEAVDSRDREVLLRYGVADGVYVDGRLVLHKVPSVAEVLRAASA